MSIPTLTPIEPDTIPDYDATADNGAKKRGRPAGSRNTGTGTPRTRVTAADKKNVETALASMSTLYSTATMGMLAVGRVETAGFLASRVDDLQASNRQAFEASPKLAQVVSSVGQFSAIGLFLSTNIAVLGMTFMNMRLEGAALRAQHEAAQQQAGHQNL